MHKTNKKVRIWVFFLVLLASFAVADWLHYQNSPLTYGLYSDTEGFWGFPMSSSTESTGGETNIQPLFIDWDSDDLIDMMTFSDSAVYFINRANDSWITKQELILDDTIYNQSTIFYKDGDTNTPILIAIVNSSIYEIAYNISTDEMEINSQLDNINPYSAPLCSYSDEELKNFCAFVLTNCSIGRWEVVTTNYTLIANISTPNCYVDKDGTLFSSWDSDYHDIAVWSGDFDGNGNYGLIAIDIDNASFETSFSGDGWYPDLSVLTIRSTAGLVGAGTKLVVNGYSGNGKIWVIKKDGTIERNHDIIANFRPVGNIIVGNVVDDSDFEYCSLVGNNIGGQEAGGIICYDVVTGTSVYTNYSFPYYSAFTYTNEYSFSNSVIADVIQTHSNNEVIFGGKVYELNDDHTFVNYTINTGGTNFHFSLSDVDNDGNVDICRTQSGYTECYFSNLNSSMVVKEGSFGRNYLSPICLGTTVTFSAWECADGDSENCQYTNDLENEDERLVTDCGDGTSLVEGNLDNSNPTVQCTFSSLATFYPRIYLQDQGNLNDYTVYEDFTYTVINGTAGYDCNLPVPDDVRQPSRENVTDDGDYIEDDDIDDAVAVLFQQSDTIKFFMVLIFTLILNFTLIKYGVKNPLLHSIMVFALWLCLAMLGILNYIYLIIYAVVAVGISAVYFMFGNNNNGGD